MVEQTKLGGVYAFLTLVAILSLVAMIGSYSHPDSDISSQLQDLQNQVGALSIPSATEIASEVNVPSAPEVTIPEFKSDEKVNNLWCSLFGYNISVDNFKEVVKNAVITKFDKDDAIDALNDDYRLVGSFELDSNKTEIADVEIGDWKCDKYTFTDDHKNKTATVTLTYDFKYNIVGNPIGDVYEGTLTVTGTYTQNYNEDDEAYENSEVDLTYSM